jgi:hypothetical protein
MKNVCCSRIQNPTCPRIAVLNTSCLLLSSISSTIVCSLYEYKWACLHSAAAQLSSRLHTARDHDPHVHFSICSNVYMTSSPTTILWLSRQISHQEKRKKNKLLHLESRASSMPPNSTYVPRGRTRRPGTDILNMFNATLFTHF